MKAGVSLSYHRGLGLINRALHREGKNAIRFRTYRDFCERTGRKIEEEIADRTRRKDWFHLKKRCQEYLSMSAKGKEKRNEILQKLLRILWTGNVDEAISYLRNLDDSLLRPTNKIADLCQYIEKHREHIPPYALRAKLGLRNSSNRVEKANDLCVAQRQKHNGMSWSSSGSGPLAQIAALILNGELLSWLYPHPFAA